MSLKPNANIGLSPEGPEIMCLFTSQFQKSLDANISLLAVTV